MNVKSTFYDSKLPQMIKLSIKLVHIRDIGDSYNLHGLYYEISSHYPSAWRYENLRIFAGVFKHPHLARG